MFCLFSDSVAKTAAVSTVHSHCDQGVSQAVSVGKQPWDPCKRCLLFACLGHKSSDAAQALSSPIQSFDVHWANDRPATGKLRSSFCSFTFHFHILRHLDLELVAMVMLFSPRCFCLLQMINKVLNVVTGVFCQSVPRLLIGKFCLFAAPLSRICKSICWWHIWLQLSRSQLLAFEAIESAQSDHAA